MNHALAKTESEYEMASADAVEIAISARWDNVRYQRFMMRLARAWSAVGTPDDEGLIVAINKAMELNLHPEIRVYADYCGCLWAASARTTISLRCCGK